jgi:hypothetical protein
MPFDQATRNLLQRTVSRCRDILAGRWDSPADGEFFKQLQEIYGISPDGTAAPLEVLEHLSDEDLETARVLREILDHYTSGLVATGKKQAEARREAVLRLAREQAFTVLNRLAALRMAEERGIVLECVRQGLQSEGFQLFQQSAGTALGSTPAAYRTYLFVLFDELSRDLGILFNRFDKSSLLFPRHEALDAILRELNGTGSANKDAAFTQENISALWAEDEAIGWIYQYYNDQAERKAMRDESAAPRNSRELAVRNQFFTPRYVVEFLTDNTLGRIWYEMTKGRTRLKEQCRYLVRRPTEIFLNPGEDAPSTPENSESNTQNPKSQEELLREPVHIPHRPLKDPRSILMLDPACGSMHFGLYAFDLFEVIYEEYWDLTTENTEITGQPLASSSSVSSVHSVVNTPLRTLYTTKEEFLRDVPRLIIENNLHGIDIDPRCAQIAGLSLWLRAQKSWQKLGVPVTARPRVRRSNIVCAEPMPGEKELLREFVERSFPVTERGIFLSLLETIFDKMQLAGEAGSLLKIEEEIRSAVAEARKHWKAGPKMEQANLFGGDKPKQKEIPLDYSGLTESEFWDQLEERIYTALRDYAEQAETGGGFQRRLFAEDAARGFAFIDVYRKRYDVVVMNPPFGEASIASRERLYESLPEAARDLFAGFVSRFNDQLQDGGRLGILGNRTAFFSEFLADWRIANFLGKRTRLTLVGDLGYGVLDAVVEAAAYVCTRATNQECQFINVLSAVAKSEALVYEVDSIKLAQSSDGYVARSLEDFQRLPHHRFIYQLPAFWVNKLNLEGDHNLFVSNGGLATGDNTRHIRLFWELHPHCVGQRWKWLAKGGEFSRYRSDLHLVVDWQNRDHLRRLGPASLFGNRGVTYTERTTSNLSARVLNEGACFSAAGPGVLPKQPEHLHFTLAYMNSFVASYCVEAIIGGGDFSIKGTAARHLEPGYMKHLPLVAISSNDAEWFRSSVTRLLRLLENFVADETDAMFVSNAIERTDGIRLGLREQNRRLFGYLQVAYQIVSSMEQRIAALLNVPKERGRDAYSDTGWPWPEEQSLPDFSRSTLSQTDPLTQHSIPKEFSNVPAKYRFEMKLSHYLHSGIERYAAELGVSPTAICRFLAQQSSPSAEAVMEHGFAFISYTFGVAFGRWDIRYATGEQAAPELPDPFAPLPVCPPGQLQNAQGLPLGKEEVGRMKEEGGWNYPIEIPWDGILVDDPNHPLDIERRVREVIEIIWNGKDGGPTAEAIEHEACEILGVKSLRDYFRKPTGFFADHLKRYSKSRRQAPIYWPLSTASGSYTLWIYYHRLTPDTLYKCLQQFVEPKIREIEQDLVRLRAMDEAGEGGRQTRDQLAKAETLRTELFALRDELAHWAPRWKPNLNDGVQITASPLWKLFLFPKWRKTLEQTWKELDRGDYDWAHLAHTLHPARVREKCKTDRSLAIAHGLEDLCQIQAPAPKKKRGKKAQAEEEELI